MLRYIGFVWDPADAGGRTVARKMIQKLRGWRCALDQPGLEVYVQSKTGAQNSVLLADKSGIVIGDLFVRHHATGGAPAQHVTRLGETASDSILRTAGRELISAYWGRYVAFLRSPASKKIHVLRDPTGRLPCLFTSQCGVRVVFSHIEDVYPLEALSFSVNWNYVAVRSIASIVETRETALQEVASVVGGECLEIDGATVTTSSYWQPSQFLSPVLDDFEQAAADLNAVTKTCVHTWAQKHQSILTMLSGGLDSSIIAACLADAPSKPLVTCLNLHSTGARSDERTYARLVADRARFRLVEEERDPRIDLGAMLSLPRTALPFHYPYKLEISDVQTRVASQVGATAIFDGNGGDGIFYAAPMEPTLRDYMHHHGVGTEFVNVAIDIARREQASIWSVLRSTFKTGSPAAEWDPLREAYRYRRLVRPEIVDTVRKERRFLHPWLLSAAGIPPGKLWHMFYMAVPLNFDHQIGGSENCELVLPILSQPIFELLLRVPAYQLISGGRDRAVARRAFSNDLPPEIVNRRSKGFREEFTRSILDRNLAFVRDVLLGGQLVQRGILDSKKLEEALSGRPHAIAASTSEVFSHLSLEVWLRGWQSKDHRAAA